MLIDKITNVFSGPGGAVVRMLLLAGLLTASNAYGQDAEDGADAAVEYGFDVDVNSRYVWRGMILNKGLLLQPSAWVYWNGFTVSEWNNVVAYATDDDAGVTEVDVDITYSLEIGPLTAEPYFVLYYLPMDESRTGEASIGLAWSINDCWSLATSHWVDVMDNAGAYYGDLSLAWAKDLSDALSLEAGLCGAWGTAAFYDYNGFGIDKSAFNAATVSVSVQQSLSDAFYLVYRGEAGVIPDEELRDALDEIPANLGIGLGAEF